MKKSIGLWIVALGITLATAVFQRISGPTYPLNGKAAIRGNSVSYKFHRSHGGNTDHRVSIEVPDTMISGTLRWKRFKTDDPWILTPMHRDQQQLTAELPNQPPAGKLMYQILLNADGSVITVPEEPVIIRFKGDVPVWALVLHILFMFGAMWVSTRAGLEGFIPQPRLKLYAWVTVGLLFIGGLLLGPIVQKYAFDAYWTGWPFGHDLTDNKTIVAFILWLIAAWRIPRSTQPKYWALAAAVALLIVFLIPHSLMGSELDYSKIPPAGK